MAEVLNTADNNNQNEKDALKSLANLIDENKLSIRKDEQFLYKILKPREFSLEYAMWSLNNYEDFVKQDNGYWLNVKTSDIKLILDSGIVSISENFDKSNCRIVWIRSGIWDPRKLNGDLILKVAGLLVLLQIFGSTPEQLGLGYIILFDMHDVGMKHVTGIKTKFAKNLVHFISKCLLVPVRQVHNVNEPKICSVVFTLFKVFLDEKSQKYLQFHGNNLLKLQESVGTTALPKELGGTGKMIESGHWLKLLENPDITKELLLTGFKISAD